MEEKERRFEIIRYGSGWRIYDHRRKCYVRYHTKEKQYGLYTLIKRIIIPILK